MNWNHKKTLKDGEKRFKYRYLDFIVNDELKSFFFVRAHIVKFLRNYLDNKGFLEVETPILNAQAGGALAQPFLTESLDLKQKLELRIAPELFLKKLIIGGFEKVYEIGKVFRNEGIDNSHNPEFTSLEFYMAYADYRDLITMTEHMLKSLCMELFGSERLLIPQFDIHHEKTQQQEILELDFRGEFTKYDVMTQLEIDPDILSNPSQLQTTLLSKIT